MFATAVRNADRDTTLSSVQIRQEGAQQPNNADLQRKPKPVRLATMAHDQGPIDIVQEEAALKLRPRRRSREAPVGRRLLIRKKLDRHPAQP